MPSVARSSSASLPVTEVPSMRHLTTVGLLCWAAAACTAHAQDGNPCADYASAPMQPPSARAAALTAELLQLPDAPSFITAVEPVAATAELPAYCRFKGTIAPQIHFELRLPQGWNGKLMMQGCGGMCGWINMGAAEDSLTRRYAVVNTDMGHTDPPYVALWAADNRQAELDFGYRATYTTAMVARAITTRFYGSEPRHRYFNGCSTGGRQGMLAAQRFPELFDGIIAGAPVLNQTGVGLLHLLWSARANLDAQGKPILTMQKLSSVHASVLGACDKLDGVADGVLQDPRACPWKPESMACGREARGDCLSAAEIGALHRLYDGASNSGGRLAWAGGGGLPVGSEYAWSPAFVNPAGGNSMVLDPAGLIAQIVAFKAFFNDPGPSMSLADFDFERDPQRLALTESFYNAQNPDLRRFKARGGKLLLYHGWDDTEVTPGYSVDYYELATRTMGGPEATREFFRLFMVPGMGHCRRGVGADAIDYLDVLERWVEHGEAPQAVLAHKLVKEQSYLGLPRPRYPLNADEYTWRRPVLAFPDVAVYSGHGDWKDPANWKARPPPQ